MHPSFLFCSVATKKLEINLSDVDLSPSLREGLFFYSKKNILKDIKSYLGVGKINQKSNGTCVYYIRSFKEMDVLIDHFEKYPLLTQKQADYLLLKSAYKIIKKK